MSDFVPRDILPDLWEEILQRHWTFLETEESMQKLEERKKLEGCLKEFLCIVPHDRKFFLPETAHVLKKSIKDMDDFSAYKAMLGFESISQYANNLFTKPWRKEYRIIKMYSGFYQHEIKSNLVDADKLFEAMGYRQLPNQILMLDGPICPDQVTNVSRDAMAAYVECQIMKQIFSTLSSMQLPCSWLDIFNFRETHIGGASQGIKSLAYAIQERRFRKEKLSAENCYATIQHPQPQSVSTCSTCAHTCHPQLPQLNNPCGIHHMPPQQPNSNYTGMCNIRSQQSPYYYMMHNNVPVAMHYKQQQQQNYGPPQMSHSKSLEHYAEHVVPSGALPHRHSFDQPYDAPYDCVDGYQSCNFNAYTHPYNVSGNRYPLPYNISNQLNAQFPGACMTGAGHYPPPPPPPPQAVAGCSHKMQPVQPDQLYGDCNGYAKKSQDMCNYHPSNGKDLMNYRQCGGHASTNDRTNSTHTDHLIDFDDRPNDMAGSHCIQVPHHSRGHNSFEYNDRTIYEQPPTRSNKPKQPQIQYEISRQHHNLPTNQAPKDLYNRNIEISDEVDGNYLYNGVRNERKSALKKPTDKYARNAEILEQYEQIIDNNDGKDIDAQGGFDSFEDILGVDGNNLNHTKILSNKNQDGVGSFESWDYVFQNLEKHGYRKDLGERGDLLVQGLDLDSMKLNGFSEKRRSRNVDTKLRPPSDNVNKSSIKLDKTDICKETSIKPKTAEKSILKHDNETVQKTITKTTQVQKSALAVQKSKPDKYVMNNNFDDHHNNSSKSASAVVNRTSTSNGTTANHYKTASGTASAGSIRPTAVASIRSSANTSTATTTATTTPTVITASPNEWSCKFCTFLNPDTKRICEMCCRSKDFNLDAANPPTCV